MGPVRTRAAIIRPLCEHMFVRWSNLTVSEQPQHRLPGYRDPASVRRFTAPEALDMRFYEVHAKSVLNRVPAASQMPFRWTVNPYRGCGHACTYCLGGDTRVLMSDARTRPISELNVGDGSTERFAKAHTGVSWSPRCSTSGRASSLLSR